MSFNPGGDVVAWVEATCERQRLQPRVSRPAAVAEVVAISGGSEAPEWGEAVGIEGVAAADGWMDCDVLDQGAEQGSTPVEGESHPAVDDVGSVTG
jgi:hypothetical protein